MAQFQRFIVVLALFTTVILLSNCGTGSSHSTVGAGGSSSGSGSGSAAGRSVPGYGEGIGAAGQTSAARFLYANPVPGGAPIPLVIQPDGTLSVTQSVTVQNNTPQTIAIDPTGSFLYQTTLFNSTGSPTTAGGVWAYTINRTNGALSVISGAPYLANLSFYSAAVDTQGKLLFAQSNAGIYVFSIQPGTGALTQVAGSPFATAGPSSSCAGCLNAANRMAVDQTDSFVYVSTAGGIYAFAINQSTGQLTPVAGSPFGSSVTNPWAVVVAPSNQFLYETHAVNDPNLYGYSINQTTGALTPLSGSPFNMQACGTPPGGSPGSGPLLDNMTIDSSSKYLYLANCGTYSIDAASGGLAQVSNFAPGDWPVIDPTGSFLWALITQSNCWHCEQGTTTYQVDPSTGNLTAVPNSTTNLANSFSGAIVSLAITK